MLNGKYGKVKIQSPDGVLGENLTRCHAATVRDILEKIDEDGFFHTSTKDAPLFNVEKKLLGYGGHYNRCWIVDAAWGIIEMAHLGYITEMKKCCDWFGQHFSHAPPRWVRWMERDGSSPGTGLFETEGHAAMLTGFATVLKHFSGDEQEIKRFWSIYATGLRWLFQLSEQSQYHHLLYDDGEHSGRTMAGGAYSIYSNNSTINALRASRKSISLLPEPHDAHFAILQKTLEDEVFAYLRDSEKRMWLQARYSDGRVQDHLSHTFNEYLPFKHVMFQLSPLTLFADSGGYWPTRDQDPQWLETSENTFDSIYATTNEWLEKKNFPVFYVGNCFGAVPPVEFQGIEHATSIQFGHGLFTEAALLLDRMSIFEKSLATIAKGVNNPYFGEKYQYVTPHLAFKGNEVYGYGDIGNLINSAEYLKLIRLMAGVDDKGESLTIMPRVPAGWNISVEDMPVAVIKNRKVRRGNISYSFTQRENEFDFSGRLTGDVSSCALRLGPLPQNSALEQINISPRIEFTPESSGNSSWIFIPEVESRKIELKVEWNKTS